MKSMELRDSNSYSDSVKIMTGGRAAIMADEVVNGQSFDA
jgi:hypothetical protein